MQSLSHSPAFLQHSLKDNMESQIYYRPTDLATAEYLEHRMGRKSGYAKSQTLREGAETSQGRSEQSVPLMTAQAIKQLKDHEVIAFHRRLPPFKIRRVDWRRHPMLVQRHHAPAPKLTTLPYLADIPQASEKSVSEHYPLGYIDPDMLQSDKQKKIPIETPKIYQRRARVTDNPKGSSPYNMRMS